MTGTAELAASSSWSACESLRIMIASTIRDSTLAVSLIGSLRPSWVASPCRNRAWPPSLAMPDSKLTRVRVEFLVKIIASVLPAKLCGRSCFRAFRARARSITAVISAAERSESFRKWRGMGGCVGR